MADSANNFAGGVELSQRNLLRQRRIVIEQMLNASGKSTPDVVGRHVVAAFGEPPKPTRGARVLPRENNASHSEAATALRFTAMKLPGISPGSSSYSR